MPPSRDDDYDWLYGRERRPSEPEPTKVILPPSRRGAPRPATLRGDDPPRPPDTIRVRAADRSRSRRRRRAGRTVVRRGRRRLGHRRPQRPSRGPDTTPARQAAEAPSGVEHSSQCSASRWLIFVWLIAVPVYAWSQISRVDDAPAGEAAADQPGTTFLLVGSDSREGLSKAEPKRLGTGSTAGQRTDTIMIVSMPPGGKPALISVPRDSYVPIPTTARTRSTPPTPSAARSCWSRRSRRTPGCGSTPTPRSGSAASSTSSTRWAASRCACRGDQGPRQPPQSAEGLPDPRRQSTPSATSGCASRPSR